MRSIWILCVVALFFYGCNAEQSNVSSCIELRTFCATRIDSKALKCPPGEVFRIDECGCSCARSLASAVPIKKNDGSLGDRTANVKLANDNAGDHAVDGIEVLRTLNDFLTLAPNKSVTGLNVFSNARRVFALDLNGDGADELFGADGKTLWGALPGLTRSRRLIEIKEGTIHKLARIIWNGKPALAIAAGRSRESLQAPVQLYVLPLHSAKPFSVFTYRGTRNDIVMLGPLMQDGQMVEGVAFGYFVSKYHTKVISISMAGMAGLVPETRMLTSFTQMTLAGQTVNVGGRIYGDKKGRPGDLRVGHEVLEVDGGVRAITMANTGPNGESNLYVSDGWDAAYAKKAKAQIKELRMVAGRKRLVSIGGSNDEYSFFRIWGRDVDGDGVDELFARGDRQLSVFWRTADGWQRKSVAITGSILNCAVGAEAQSEQRSYWIATPGQPSRIIRRKVSEFKP